MTVVKIVRIRALTTDMIAGTDRIDLSPEINPSTSLSVTMATDMTGATSSWKLSRDALTLYVRGYQGFASVSSPSESRA